MKKGAVLAAFIIFLAYMPFAFAIDQIVANSQDWQDVYSAYIYGSLLEKNVFYVVEETQGLQLYTDVLERAKRDVLLINSDKEPYIFGSRLKLESLGFRVEELTEKNINLELAKKLVDEKEVNSFIVVDNALGYNSIVVAPYAIVSNSYVLFANKENLDGVVAFLESVNVEGLIVYGHLDRLVRGKLEVFSPTVINTGDKYLDNIKIIEKFLDIRPNAKQLILTNGEFIEPTFFSNEFPVLLMGTSYIPTRVLDFIKDEDMKTAIVVGYELAESAIELRKSTGLRIFLKYGQGRNGEMFALDIYPIPSHIPVVDLGDIRYNIATKKLEVTFENTGDVFAYVQSLSHAFKVDGFEVGRVGDEEAFFLSDGDVITLTYDADLIGYLDDVVLVESKVIFGDTLDSLDRSFSKETIMDTVTVEDNSRIRISKVLYNTKTKRFEVTVDNIGERDAYVKAELKDMLINDEKATMVSEQQEIYRGDSSVFKIKVVLDEVDIADNPSVTVSARYGEREDSLIKSATEEFPLVLTGTDWLFVMIVGGIVVVVLFLLFLIFRRIFSEEREE